MEAFLSGTTLLVGEGDFSFAVALAERILKQGNKLEVVATSLESEETINKHKNAVCNMQHLQKLGVNVMLNTDATQLHCNSALQNGSFHNIVFNFPHAGGKSNHKKNRKLLNDFFASAVQVIHDEGQILVTLCKGQGGTPADRPMRAWHDSWQVVSMAANSDLILTAMEPFVVYDYSTYSSTGFRSLDKGFNTDRALIHMFKQAAQVEIPETVVNHRHVRVADSYYTCSMHLHSSLMTVRNVNKSDGHIIHRIYSLARHYLMSSMQSGSSNSTVSIQSGDWNLVDTGLRQPIISPTSVLRDVDPEKCYKLCQVNETDRRMEDLCLHASGSETTCLTDLTSTDLGDTNQGHLYQTLLLVPEPSLYAVIPDDRSVSMTYAPVFTKCKISPDESVMSYYMTIAWSLDSELPRSLQNDLESDDTNVKGRIQRSADECVTAVINCLKKLTEDALTFNTKFEIATSPTSETDNCDHSNYGDCSSRCDEVITTLTACMESSNLSDGTGACEIEIGQVHRITGGFKKSSNFTDSSSLAESIPSAYSNNLTSLAVSKPSADSKILTSSTSLVDCTGGNHKSLGLGDNQNSFTHSDNHCLVATINLCKLICAMYNIEDGRLLWSTDDEVVEQFQSHSIAKPVKSVSIYPMTYTHDMSFWERGREIFDEQYYMDVIRDIAGDNVTHVQLLERYTDPSSGKSSRCYRLSFQSVDKALSYNTSWKLQSIIRLEVQRRMGIILR